MDRLKNSGFYKLKFLVTPEEFKGILELFEQKEAQFSLSNAARTTHDLNQVHEAYTAYYQYFTGQEKLHYLPHFVYSITMKLDDKTSGFFIKNEGISFPYRGAWAEDELSSIMLSLPKGFQLHLEDEKGKYYVYEDIREHLPLTHAFYEEVGKYIKKNTKLLCFSVGSSTDDVQELKPSVRVSRDAAADLANSWILTTYSLVLNMA
ncbi:hypothetical protein [Paenibacillus sp. 7523-1]|uniref:hypothetical protein n=1 Tax=Paenibacillus sp. 7523-1 TaxID=2022550 RepID=UPI000BA5A28D|nr:hypothetical protein [Paenibacillus sp. 7523-1]PAD30549.1 hypothetical protein CHH60_17375 [Paenibacillus sp. 7523-1]